MPYTPTKAIINPKALVANVKAYILANQADALLWAHGSALKAVREFSDSVGNRLVPVYPSIAFSDDNSALDLTGDVQECQYTVTFEVNIHSKDDPDIAAVQANSYWQAFVSLIVNMGDADKTPDTGARNAQLLVVESGFLPIKADIETQREFLQTFQIRATYNLLAE